MGVVDGYEAEPHEVSAVVAALVGDRDPGDDDKAWFAHLSSRLALLSAAAERVSQQRDQLAADMLATYDMTERQMSEYLGLSSSRAGALARRARKRDGG